MNSSNSLEAKNNETKEEKNNHSAERTEEPVKDIILFIGGVEEQNLKAVDKLGKKMGVKYKKALLISHLYNDTDLSPGLELKIDIIIKGDMNNDGSIEKKILDIHERVAIVVAYDDVLMPLCARVVPLFPYLKCSSERSLMIASDKLEMRKVFWSYSREITPKFLLAEDYKKTTIKKVAEKVGFPCVIKPANLSQSRHITVCYYPEELRDNLKKIFREALATYKKIKVELDLRILVEEFLVGNMYSIDAYVDGEGNCEYTPIIEVKTAKDKGIDDFYLYTQSVPADISLEEEQAAQEVVQKAVHAIGLKYSSAHAELMQTKDGWKIIEVGARLGGYRDLLLKHSFGIDHNLNDLLIRLDKKTIIKRKKLSYIGIIKFYSETEGKLKSISGIKKVQKLNSFARIYQKIRLGEYCGLAKQGYPFIIMVAVKAPTKSELLGEFRKVEKLINIEIE